MIVGGGQPGNTYRPVLERLIREGGLERHVLLAGERTHDEIPRWLAAADLFCLATRSEGWANVLLESLACGRPVVTTRVGGNAEIITGEHLGTLVPHGDDQALAQAVLAALGRSWDPEALASHARRHSWDVTADHVLEELTRLGERGAPRGTAEPLGDSVEGRR